MNYKLSDFWNIVSKKIEEHLGNNSSEEAAQLVDWAISQIDSGENQLKAASAFTQIAEAMTLENKLSKAQELYVRSL